VSRDDFFDEYYSKECIVGMGLAVHSYFIFPCGNIQL
jgi:hypothetical protein